MSAILAVIVGASDARADESDPPPPQPPRALPDSDDLDGLHLHLGPAGGALLIEGAWDGAFGAQVSLLRVRERAALAARGVAVSGARYSERDGGRLSAELLVGTRRVGDVLVGVTAGPAVELGAVHHPRAGVTGSVWLFTGVVPFVRGGWYVEAGGYLELGVAIPLPARRW